MGKQAKLRQQRKGGNVQCPVAKMPVKHKSSSNLQLKSFFDTILNVKRGLPLNLTTKKTNYKSTGDEF